MRQLPAASSGRKGKRLGPTGSVHCSTTSSGGPPQVPGRRGCCQGPPNAVLATACWTATDSMLHHRRVQPAAAAARMAGGARWALTRTSWRTKLRAPSFHRPPTSEPRTTSFCGPARASSEYAACLRRSATRNAAPSMVTVHGCGCPVRVSGDTSVASQHNAPPCGVAPYTTRSSLRRSSAPTFGAVVCASHYWGDNLAIRSQRLARDTHPGMFHDCAGARECVIAISVDCSSTPMRRAARVPANWQGLAQAAT